MSFMIRFFVRATFATLTTANLILLLWSNA